MLKYLLLLLYSISFFSCIGEDNSHCRAIIRMHATIVDTLYFNEPSKVANTSFSDFVNELNYLLINSNKQKEKSGKLAIDKNSNGSGKIVKFDIPQILLGQYVLIAWGNVGVESQDMEQGDLHPANKESLDLFVAGDYIDVAYTKIDKHIYFHRAKGKLRVFCENIPQEITQLSMNVNNIYQSVDSRLAYTGITNLTKKIAKTDSFDTHIAPTCINKESIVDFELSDDTGILYRISNIPVTIKRNEISELRLRRVNNQWFVDIKVDESWEMISNLSIGN